MASYHIVQGTFETLASEWEALLPYLDPQSTDLEEFFLMDFRKCYRFEHANAWQIPISLQGGSMPYEDHIAEAKDAVTCAVLTISDTRTEEDDKSGKIILELLKDGGHTVGYYAVVKDEADQIKRLIIDIASKGECHVILTNGGTGIAARDTTFEAVTSLLEKRLDGFGEVFRFLSWDDIGSGAMLSRAKRRMGRPTL